MDSSKMIFRNTNKTHGRTVSVTPENSTLRHLAYARIILKDPLKSVGFTNAGRETGFIVLSGAAKVSVNGKHFDLVRYDAIYIPRDSAIEVATGLAVDIAEFSSEVDGDYPLQIVRYSELSKDPALKFTTGVPGQQRHLNIVLGKNVDAGRLVAGFTVSEPGNWTSWPPHEHAQMLEELYVYFNMPEPAFGIQMVYDDTQSPELVTVVRDGDAVLIPSGYHPNVSVPGHCISFLWAMAAHREKEDRQFGVVNVQPGFDGKGTGLEASRK
jgi:5-deoxy-glucuronate isomerase